MMGQCAPQYHDEVTEDLFLGGKINALQPRKGFRAGSDTVFLAAAVPAKSGQTLFEAGIGPGIASLCVLDRVEDIHVDGLELCPQMVSLARENARRNGFSDKFNVIEGDARLPGIHFEERGLKQDSYDHVFANPPYYSKTASRSSPHPLKARARAHSDESMEGWIRGLVALAKPKATITLVHRADMLEEILQCLKGRAGNCLIRSVHSFRNQPAGRIIVQAIKASKAPLKMLPPFVVHKSGGDYTKLAAGILRHGKKMDLQRL